MAIYMQVDGITGDVETAPYAGWIELNRVHWGVGRGIKSAKGGGKDREGAEANISEVSITKTSCGATPDLMRLAMWGKSKTVKIEITHTGDNKQQSAFHKYELDDVLFSGYSTSTTGDRPSEDLNLNFTKLTFSNVPSDDKHGDAAANRLQFDLCTGAGS